MQTRLIGLSRAAAVVAALALCESTFAQSGAPLVHKSDLTYQGAFRVPAGSPETATFSWGGTALGFNPAKNSLFIVGHDWHQRTAEISIPEIRNSTDVNSLATATLLQTFADATDGKLDSINPTDPNPQKIGGHLVYNGRLYVTGYSYYDGAVTQLASHFARPLDLATKGQVTGPIKVGSLYPGFVAGYMASIPEEWRAAFGGPALSGHCCVPGASWQSQGPAASVFDPAQLDKLASVPAMIVLGYQYPNVLGPGETTTNPLYNLTTRVTGMVFAPGTGSVLFFGRHGIGKYCYGEGSTCGDPADQYKGTHAYPYVYQVWAYDANDLVSVKKGAKLPYAVQPYATWIFNLPFEKSGDAHWLGGAAFDPATKRVYVSQQHGDSDHRPIIHVFKLEVGAPVVAPKPPTDVAVE